MKRSWNQPSTDPKRTQGPTVVDKAEPSEMTSETYQHPPVNKDSTHMNAIPPEADSTGLTNFAIEVTRITSRPKKLSCSLDSCLATKKVSLNNLEKLTTSVGKIKTHLECSKRWSDDPVKSLIRSVRILRNDVNSRLENKQEKPNSNTPPGELKPTSVGYGTSQINGKHHHVLSEPTVMLPRKVHNEHRPPINWDQILDAQGTTKSTQMALKERLTTEEEP